MWLIIQISNVNDHDVKPFLILVTKSIQIEVYYMIHDTNTLTVGRSESSF